VLDEHQDEGVDAEQERKRLVNAMAQDFIITVLHHIFKEFKF
jgi:hypothetical protein